MREKVEAYGRNKHTGVFFLIILSHEASVNNGVAVIGTDSEAVEVDQLESSFNDENSPSLQKVPKIFLIDACRGSRTESTFKPRSHHIKTSYRRLESKSEIQLRSTSSDFAIIFALTSGNGHFTQAFVKVITEAKATASLKHIVSKVISEVKSSDAKKAVEVKFAFNMTRKYFIKRYVHSF